MRSGDDGSSGWALPTKPAPDVKVVKCPVCKGTGWRYVDFDEMCVGRPMGPEPVLCSRCNALGVVAIIVSKEDLRDRPGVKAMCKVHQGFVKDGPCKLKWDDGITEAE